MPTFGKAATSQQRVYYAGEFVKVYQQIEEMGYLCYMGSHRQQHREKDRSRMIYTLGVMTTLPKEGAAGTRYAMIELEGAWESMEEDRAALPLIG